MDFASFKKRVDESEKEIFTEWDDLILWEGNKEWKRKYEGLKDCIV